MDRAQALFTRWGCGIGAVRPHPTRRADIGQCAGGDDAREFRSVLWRVVWRGVFVEYTARRSGIFAGVQSDVVWDFDFVKAVGCYTSLSVTCRYCSINFLLKPSNVPIPAANIVTSICLFGMDLTHFDKLSTAPNPPCASLRDASRSPTGSLKGVLREGESVAFEMRSLVVMVILECDWK